MPPASPTRINGSLCRVCSAGSAHAPAKMKGRYMGKQVTRWTRCSPRRKAPASTRRGLASFSQDKFVQIEEHCLPARGIAVMKWLTSCTYWQKRRVKGFSNLHHLKNVDLHGCAVGLTSRSGAPIKKPWALATNCLAIREAFKDN
eukprot:686180-Amphidinium_carterae.1